MSSLALGALFVIVRVIYFNGCPNHAAAVALAKSVVADAGVDATVEAVEVRNQREAEQLRFLGSPTIQVDGVDIEPEARRRREYSFSCRMYGTTGLPSRELTMAAILKGDKATMSNTTLIATGGSVAAAVIASACCWLPPLLLVMGVSAVGVSATFASVRPWFLAGAFLLLGLGFYLSYLRKPDCKPGSVCAAPNPKLVRFNRAMLWVAFVGVLAFAFFPKLFAVAAGDGTAMLSPAVPKITLAIEGMTCESCASSIQKSLQNITGVSDASVSYHDSQALVAIDGTSPPTEDALVNAVEKAGFHASVVK